MVVSQVGRFVVEYRDRLDGPDGPWLHAGEFARFDDAVAAIGLALRHGIVHAVAIRQLEP